MKTYTVYSTDQTIQILKQHSSDLQKKFRLSGLALYGSYAEGRQHEGSDIDLLYEVKEGERFPLMRLVKFQQYIAGLLNVDRVEAVNKKYINPVVYHSLNNHVITIF